MISRAASLLTAFGLAAMLTACADASNPTSVVSPSSARLSGSGVDTTLAGGGGGGGGGGSNQTQTACGILSTTVRTTNIIVYTTRIGIGFSGSLTNCGSRKESFQVDVVDINTNPACIVNVPHFIALRNTDPAMTTPWQANSTLVNCMNTTHTFTVTLRDLNSSSVLATTTVSAFL